MVDESGVLVLATESTVEGGAYQSAISKLKADVVIKARACPLWVTLAEQGITEGSLAQAIVEHDLSEVDPSTVLLGCTHFPVFKPFLTQQFPSHRFVDSAETTAQVVQAALGERKGAGLTRFLATDGAKRFQRVGGYFLGEDIRDVELVDL